MRLLQQRYLSPIRLPPDLGDAPYQPVFRTIAHTVLDADIEAENIPSAIYKKLDRIIQRAANTIQNQAELSHEQATEKLQQIEDILTEENFVCAIPYELIHSLAQGIAEKPLMPRVKDAAENARRRPHIESHLSESFSHIDCDLGTLLYLAIAEVVNLPLFMSEVPQHNFIRCRLDSGTYMNWDTNYGYGRWTNIDYAQQYGVTDALEQAGTYLANMSRDNTLGYFCFVRGILFDKMKAWDRSLREYYRGVEFYPQSPSARNNAAWLFASERAAQAYIGPADAIRFGTEACTIHRRHTHLDTLACVYAEVGEFEKAMALEQEAITLSAGAAEQEGYARMYQAFREGKTYLDMNPGGAPA